MNSDIKNRFICDVMLGKLAKWLRIIGFDTLYFNRIDDFELIKLAKQENRIILTRDRALTKNKAIDNVLLICSNNTLEQLEEFLLFLKEHLDEISNFSSRCVNCNGELMKIQKEFILNDAPEYIVFSKKFFLKCYNCGKIFWEGSHKKMICTTIEKMINKIKMRNH